MLKIRCYPQVIVDRSHVKNVI